MSEVVPLAVNVGNFANSVNAIWLLTISFLIFFMQPGFLLLEVGQVRSKNVANVAMKNLFDWSLGVLVFFLLGLGIANLVGDLTSSASFSMSESFSYINSPEEWIGWLAGAVFAMTATTIVSGAVVERIKFKSYVLYSVVLTMVIYPVVVGLTWQGGLLAEEGYLGSVIGVGYLDFAGGTVVHMVGGLAGLVGASILGPRHDRYDTDGESKPIPGHSVLFGVLGTLFLAFGWFGFNVGTQATVLTADGEFLGAELGRVALVTTLGMGAGAVCSSLVTMAYQGKPDPLFTANGLLAGLVAVTAGAAYVTWWGGLLLGGVGGALVYPTFRWTVDTLGIDDVCGVFAVHGMAGGVGAILIPLVGVESGQWSFLGVDQLVSQVAGVVIIGTWTVLATITVFQLIQTTFGLRIDEADERTGLDKSEHNVIAYPNFVTDGGANAAVSSSMGTQESDSPTMWRGEEIGDTDEGILDGAGIENIPDVAYVVDESNEVAALNTKAIRFFQTVEEEALGSSPDTLVERTDTALSATADALTEGREVRDRAGTLTVGGDTVPVRVTATPLYENDTVAGAVALIRNNADQVARTQQRQTAREYRDEVLDKQESKLERLADGDLDIEAGIPAPPTDRLEELQDTFAAIDSHIVATAENVQRIVERLPDQSAELAATSTDLSESSSAATEAITAIDELATDIDDDVTGLSRRVGEAHENISEVSATIEEVSAATEEIEQQSTTATELTAESTEEMSGAVEQIRAATEHSNEVAAQIDELETQMDSVAEIVDIIDTIADQTNMLALNAAIEATNADENGDGFAVVADEVKSLAEQTKESAGEIATIVETAQEQTDQVAATIDDANEEITEGADAVAAAVTSLEEVHDNTEEIHTEIGEINRAIQQQATNTETVSATTQEVVEMTDDIRGLVERVSTRADNQTERMNGISELAGRLSALADDVHANIDHFNTVQPTTRAGE